MTTQEICRQIEAGRDKIKKIEAKQISARFCKDSVGLEFINDIINRTALAIRDKLFAG